MRVAWGTLGDILLTPELGTKLASSREVTSQRTVLIRSLTSTSGRLRPSRGPRATREGTDSAIERS